MKKTLLLTAVVTLSLGANAQWVKPTPPNHDIVVGDTVRLLNVEYGAFLGGANAWGTQTSLITPGLDYVLRQSDNGKDYKMETASGAKKGKFLFRDNESGCFIDMGSQNKGFNWTFTKTESGYYTIKSPQDDPVYGEVVESIGEAWAHQYFGWNGDKNIVYANVDPEGVDADGKPLPCGIEWAVMSREEAAAYVEAIAPYTAAMELKAVIDKAKADYPSVDCSKAEAVYNNTNSTVEELQDAKKLVANAIAALRSQEVLVGASPESPVDGTELIENPDFSTGDISGWVCTFESGTTATNVGYQGANYTGLPWTDDETGESGVAAFDKFIEAWANNVDEMKRDGKTFATIGDAKLCQTIYGLPAGKYKLSCDANAVQQWEGSQNPVTGVQLYATAGEIDSHLDMATGNGIPEHFILTFIHNGGDVELGLRTSSTTANWIGADNFRLMYYGEITENPYLSMLKDAVAAAQKKYEDVELVMANAEVKSAYEAALAEAEAAEDGQEDAYYQALQAKLDEALKALNASVEAYKVIAATLEEAYDRMSNVPENWSGLSDQIGDKYYSWKEKYEAGDYVPGDEVALTAELNQMIADFISANAQAGDDVTLLLKNPGFDKDFSGWDKAEGSATPAWGGCKKNPEGDLTGHEELEEYRETGLPGGNAEVYHNSFDISQTIKNMPAGLYELSCKAFERDEDGKVDAELYAKLAGDKEQSVKVMEIKEDLAPVEIYHYGQETPDGNNSRDMSGDGTGWAPDGMSSANWHFAAGYYKNKFNIVVTEAGDITVGVRTTSKADWVLFDDFKLVYLGGGAAVYEGAITDLIAKGDKTIEDGYSYNDTQICGASQEVLNQWDAAKAAADGVWASGSEEQCVAAINALEEAIEAINASVAVARKLYDAYDAGNTRMSFMEEAYAISCDEALQAIEAVYDSMEGDGYATDAAMEAAIESINAAFTQDVLNAKEAAKATEEAPADITAVIANATYEWNADNRNDYWTNTGKAPHGWMENGVTEDGRTYITAEVWNGTFTHSQTICSLPAGFYRLKVNAFQRGAGFNKHSEQAANDSIGEPLTAKLFAGSDTTKIASLFSDVDKYDEIFMAEDSTIQGAKVSGGLYDGKVVPNNMAQAVAAFNAGLYHNILQFEVKEKGNVELGLSKAEKQGDDWVIFGNWKLEYLGTKKPATDPTTEIAGIEAMPAVRAIYDLMGRKVNSAVKGIYIINGKKIVR